MNWFHVSTMGQIPFLSPIRIFNAKLFQVTMYLVFFSSSCFLVWAPSDQLHTVDAYDNDVKKICNNFFQALNVL